MMVNQKEEEDDIDEDDNHEDDEVGLGDDYDDVEMMNES